MFISEKYIKLDRGSIGSSPRNLNVLDLGLKRIRDFGFESYGWVGFSFFQKDSLWLMGLIL